MSMSMFYRCQHSTRHSANAALLTGMPQSSSTSGNGSGRISVTIFCMTTLQCIGGLIQMCSKNLTGKTLLWWDDMFNCQFHAWVRVQNLEEYLQSYKAHRERLHYDHIIQWQRELDLSAVPIILHKMVQCTGSDNRPSRLSISALLDWEDNLEYIDQHKLGRNG